MKRCIQLSVLLLPLISFGAATPAHLIQLPLKPNASLQKIAISADGSFAAFTECVLERQPQSNELLIPRSSKGIFISPLSLPTPTNWTYHLTLIKTSDGTQIPCKIDSEPYTLTFSQDGQTLAVGSDPNAGFGKRCIRLFKTGTGENSQTIRTPEYKDFFVSLIPTDNNCLGAAIHACFNRAGTHLLTTDLFCHHHPRAWSAVTRTSFSLVDIATNSHQLIYTGRLCLCAFNPNDERICTAQVDDRIKVWDLRDHRREKLSFNLSRQTGHCLCISPDGTTLCASSRDAIIDAGKITLFDLRKQDPTQEFFLETDTESDRESFAGATFEVLIPALKAFKSHKKLVGEAPFAKACTNADETVLLYQANKGEPLCLVKK